MKLIQEIEKRFLEYKLQYPRLLPYSKKEIVEIKKNIELLIDSEIRGNKIREEIIKERKDENISKLYDIF